MGSILQILAWVGKIYRKLLYFTVYNNKAPNDLSVRQDFLNQLQYVSVLG